MLRLICDYRAGKHVLGACRKYSKVYIFGFWMLLHWNILQIIKIRSYFSITKLWAALNNYQSVFFFFSLYFRQRSAYKYGIVNNWKKTLSVFRGTLLNKCENIRYQNHQTENIYFQENVLCSPLEVKCWKSTHLYFSIFYRLQIYLFSDLPPFYQWTVLEVEEYKTIAPTKSFWTCL